MKHYLPTSRILLCLVAILFALPLSAAEALSPEENQAVLKRLLPRPTKVEFFNAPEVVFDNTLTLQIELAAADDSVQSKTLKIFKNHFGHEPAVRVAVKADAPQAKDAYRIAASGKIVTISAADFSGVRYALSTLRQMAESNHDGMKFVAYSIPETKIEDAPAMSFRGIHICWFPETRFKRIEQAVRLAAYYKFNYAVIEFWGTFPSEKHPNLSWKEFEGKPEDIKRLVSLGKELGITLIPQYNIFGHASGSRWGSLKHVPLDRHPEYQPLFEPDGWTWCLSNPSTREVLLDIVLELYEMFDRPPYFHVGCDEAGEAECRRCLREDYKKLFEEHLLYFHKILAEKNCKMMMWEDMLLSKSDPRWKDYEVRANKHTVGLVEKLPKDIVMCDWQYAAPKEKENWATMRYLKELGFPVLACPFTNMAGMRSQGKTIGEAGLDGMLCTTWHHMRGNDMYRIFSMGGQVTWHAGPNYPGVWEMIFAIHLRQIGWDMQNDDYRDTGHVDWQLRPETSL